MGEMPSIIRETNQGFFRLSLADEMLAHREVECAGSIDTESAYSLCCQLRYLQREDPSREITFFLNSPGGEVRSGLAVYDVMQGISCPIRTVCLGQAASMAAVLFAAGNRRDILPHAQVMIHDPLISNGVGGSAMNVYTISQNLLNVRETLGRILAGHTGRTLEEIYEKTAHDTIFNAREAVEFGLADRVIDTL